MLILTFLMSTVVILSQTTGKIVGSVSDASGAIAGATVVVTDNQTNRERTVTSGSDGTYTVSQLEFGTYTVKITATGFKAFTANELKVDAGREYSLDALLEVGAVSEEVVVTAGVDTINATNAELSTTIGTQQIRELPLNGRNPLSLLSLQAGANVTTNSINGQRSSSTTITRDGLNVQDNFIRTGRFVSDQPTVDDTGEFTVTTQNAGVEQGGGSSIVQLVTPRGGSKFHGNLFEFNRNSKFTANSFFNNAARPGIAKPFLNRNQFGGSISGPVPLPYVGEGTPVFLKNKGFFFFNYEQFRLAQQATIFNLTTLLAPARNGDFSYTGTDNVTRTVNILSGTGLNLTGTNAGTFASAGGPLTVDPIIQTRFLNLLPTDGNGTTAGVNFTKTTSLNRSDPLRRDAWTGRFDVDLNDQNSFNAVYKRNNSLDARTDIAAGFSPNVFVDQGGPTNFWVAAWRLTLGSNFSNEFRGGFQKSEPFFDDKDFIPTDYLIGQGLTTTPEASFFDQGRNTRYRNVQNNAVYTWGDHSFRFGGQAEFYEFSPLNAGGTVPTFTISTTANPNTPGLTSALFTGISAADLARANTLRYTLAGIVGTATRTANLVDTSTGYGFGPAVDIFNFELYSGYVSDQWRARSNLTLNLGLRYEFYTPLNTPVPKYLEPVFTNPDDIVGSLSQPNAVLDIVGKNSGSPGTYFKADKNNFAPSVSFAYSPKFDDGMLSKIVSGDTVVRGGFRINYINDEYTKAASTLVAANPGLGALALTATNLRATLSPRAGFTAPPNFSTLPPVAATPILLSTNNANGQFARTLFGVDPNFEVQRNMEYNIGIQRNLFLGTVLEVRYVGGRSNTASRTNDFNQVDITSNGFLADFQRARENCRIQGLTTTGGATAFDPTFFCTNANNIGLPGQQNLTVFSNLTPPTGGTPGNLTNATNLSFIANNTAASLAREYVRLRQQGGVVFQPTSNSYALEILTNGGSYNYNALQAEIRRRFDNGLYFQVNYTFQKSLTDILADANADQNRQGTFLDNNNPRLNYGRADYDRTHTINANAIYELPFGKGKKFLNDGGIADVLFGGFTVTSIVNLSSGPPLGIVDPRATFNTRATGRQSARTNLSTAEIKKFTGIFNTPNGIYFVNPSILNATIRNASTNVTQTGFDLNQPLPTGFTLVSVRAASPINQAPFPGQVFFFNKAGEVGNLPTNFLNGMPFLNWDASIGKNFRFTESMRLQVRMEAFNVLNLQVPFFGADLNINSDNFGRVTQSYNGPRIIQFGARFDF